MFQLHHLLPELTAQQNVELPLLAAKWSRRERAQRTAESLGEVGLGDRLQALPADLSGGERQRVAIARALAARPKLILADEPTGALDSRASLNIWELLQQVNEQHGTTMIIASHDPAVVERTDRTMNLVDGRIAPRNDDRSLKEAAHLTGLVPALAAVRRRPGRTLLTSLGTALGIATIVALLAVSQGAQAASQQFFHLGASDLGLFQKRRRRPDHLGAPAEPRLAAPADARDRRRDAADPAGPGDQATAGGGRVRRRPERVRRAAARVRPGPHLQLESDRSRSATARGADAPEARRHGQGRRPSLHGLGIYHIGVAYQDDGAYIPLAAAQAISGRQDEATTIAVKLGVGTQPSAAERTLRRRFPGLLVIGDGQEAPRAGANGQLLSQDVARDRGAGAA